MRRMHEFNPTPLEMAQEFAAWSSEEQAGFLQHVATIFHDWGSHKKDMQVLGIGHALRDHWPDAVQLVRELAADTEEAAEKGSPDV